jgi:hydroxymethylglutaryl-CoA reductase
LGANALEKEKITTYFDGKTVTHAAVVSKFEEIK